MNKKSRNLLLLVAVVILSVMVWSVAAAQDATSTAEPQPNPASTAEPSAMANPAATTEPSATTATAKPFLGVSLQDGANGVTVGEVVDGSGAATAGIKVGDVITAINGTKVTTAQEAATAVAALKVGDSVTIDLTRAGATMTVTATLGTLPQGMQPGQPINPPGQPMNPPGQRQPRTPGNGNGNGNGFGFRPNPSQMMPMLTYMFGTGHLGITFQTIDANLAKTNNLSVTDGALVTAVEAGSPAEKAGIKLNDVITAVDGDKVDAKRPLLYRLLPYQSGDTVTLSILRSGASQDIQVTLDQAQRPTMGGMFGGMFPFNFNFQGPRGFRFGQPGQNGQNNAQATPEATPNL